MWKRAPWFSVIGILTLPAVAALSWTGCQGTCASSDECADNEFCSMAVAVCVSSRAIGFCKPIPTDCPSIASTVCGCDGKTYANTCEASVARQSVASTGACNIACGGTSNTPCSSGNFCRFADGACGAASATGSCAPVPATCVSAPNSPVCGCDGKTYPSRCDADAAGISVVSTGACPCGGTANLECEDGKFCDYAVGSCAQPNPSGSCATPPTECATFSNPVCGCDNKTYVNACEAAKAQVSIYESGPCPCGGSMATDCPDGYYCNYGMTGNCLKPNPVGSCEVVPDNCNTVPSTVCGCNGVTYLNECVAAQAGASVAAQGACKDVPDAGADGG